MAQMIPGDVTHLHADTTRGEKALYKIIKKHTPNDWICYACQELSEGNRPDFVIIGPDLGVVILEEKNIPLNLVKKFTTETWTVIRDGNSEEEHHPLRQARGYVVKAIRVLKKYKRLTDKKGRLKFVYIHGVVLSGISRNELVQANIQSFSSAPIETFEPHLVISSDELPTIRQKESDFAKRIRKMASLFSFDNLDDGDIQTIRGALYPEVRARFLADDLTDRNAVLESLTVEQEQMARGIGKNDKVPHRLLKGVAGCGKSIILRTRATDIARQNPNWNILVTFFTRSLKNYLGKKLPPNVEVKTIGQVIWEQYKKFYDRDIEFDSRSEDFCAGLTNYLVENNYSKGKYHAILVDEVQDINGAQVGLLRHLLDQETNCAFFCGDDAQNIFGQKMPKWKEHGFLFQGRTSTLELSCNYRNTQQIFDFAWNYIQDQFDNEEQEASGLLKALGGPYQNVECKRLGPKPYLREYNNTSEEFDAIVQEINRLIKEGKVAPGLIGILHPIATGNSEKKITPLKQALKQKNIPVYWLSKDRDSKIDYDPDINKVTLSTPDSGKGLEWDIVFMLSINKYHEKKSDALRFVAAMRARNILYPSVVKNY